jgi:UPF0271 protein
MGPTPTVGPSLARAAIDLNADLGEGVSGDPGLDPERLDDLLLQQVSSANVACGGHAGDDRSMARVCRLAVKGGVAIGAQVSYVDRAGFGRVRLDVAHETLVTQLAEQVAALRAIAATEGGAVSYVKPHGALYNAAADDRSVAESVVESVLSDADRHGHTPYPLLTLPGCALAQVAAARGVAVVGEAFADRAYTSDARLVPRGTAGAVLDDPATVVARVVRLATQGLVRSIDGTDVAIRAASVCLHSDTPGAARTAALVRTALIDAGVAVVPFAASL